MIYNFVTWVNFAIAFAFLVIGVVFCVIPPIRWRLWAKAERKKDKNCPHSDWYYSFGEWVEDHVAHVIANFSIGILALIVFLVSVGCDASTVYTNQVEEPARYEYAIIRAETLKDALDVTEDIVNTDLYASVVGYNAQLATIKAKAADPIYAINFSGDYDWGALDYINLKE